MAIIQKRVLTAVTQSQDNNLDPAKMDALAFTLLQVSDLYNEYACPLNLFDICLLLLATCKHNVAQPIVTLWKSVICEEILPCRTGSASVVAFLMELKQGSMLEEEKIALGEGGNDAMKNFDSGEWMPRLKNRVATLGKELFGHGADYTFPLDLIVKELEGLRQTYISIHEEDHVSQPWPAQTVLDVGVPFHILFDTYNSFQTIGNVGMGGVDVATRLQWLSNMSEFLEMWVEAALLSHSSSSQGNSASSQLTQVISTGLLQNIGVYKSALGALAEGSVTSTAVVEERFTSIEEIIRRDF